MFDFIKGFLTCLILLSQILFAKEPKDRVAFVSELWYKSSNVVQSPQKASYFFLGLRWWHILNGFDFVRVNFDPFFADYKA